MTFFSGGGGGRVIECWTCDTPPPSENPESATDSGS